MFETLTIEHAGPVATLWMARPEVFNAFNEQLIDELTRACALLEQDASVRVVVLGGRGLHFSAGADLNWMRRARPTTGRAHAGGHGEAHCAPALHRRGA